MHDILLLVMTNEGYTDSTHTGRRTYYETPGALYEFDASVDFGIWSQSQRRTLEETLYGLKGVTWAAVLHDQKGSRLHLTFAEHVDVRDFHEEHGVRMLREQLGLGDQLRVTTLDVGAQSLRKLPRLADTAVI